MQNLSPHSSPPKFLLSLSFHLLFLCSNGLSGNWFHTPTNPEVNLAFSICIGQVQRECHMSNSNLRKSPDNTPLTSAHEGFKCRGAARCAKRRKTGCHGTPWQLSRRDSEPSPLHKGHDTREAARVCGEGAEAPKGMRLPGDCSERARLQPSSRSRESNSSQMRVHRSQHADKPFLSHHPQPNWLYLPPNFSHSLLHTTDFHIISHTLPTPSHTLQRPVLSLVEHA